MVVALYNCLRMGEAVVHPLPSEKLIARLQVIEKKCIRPNLPGLWLCLLLAQWPACLDCFRVVPHEVVVVIGRGDVGKLLRASTSETGTFYGKHFRLCTGNLAGMRQHISRMLLRMLLGFDEVTSDHSSVLSPISCMSCPYRLSLLPTDFTCLLVNWIGALIVRYICWRSPLVTQLRTGSYTLGLQTNTSMVHLVHSDGGA
jgi:hypothetical protein